MACTPLTRKIDRTPHYRCGVRIKSSQVSANREEEVLELAQAVDDAL